MFRSQIIAGILSVCGFFAWAAGSGAQEPKAAPKELRMWHVGNSWSATLPFEAMGLPRVFYHHTHNFGHSKPEDVLAKGWIGEALKKDKAQKNLLEKGDFDVVYLGFVQLHSPLPAMDEFFDIIQKHKPGARIYLQHAWAHGGNDKQTHDDDDLDKYDADWAKRRAAIEAAVDTANKRAGKQVVFIIPLHDAVMKMRRMVKAGQFPKVTKQEQLFVSFDGKRDEHGNNQIYALAAYCAYAAIHGKSPVGMRPNFPANGNLASHPQVPLDDEQNAVLQKLAWETVSKYPYAQDPKSEPTKKLPAGLRVMNGGHSWSTENSVPLCQAAGITAHKKITGINGNRIDDVKPLLEKGEIDVYVWQRSEVGPESPSFLPTLVELGPKHNPNFRVHIQLPWLVHDGRKNPKSPDEYETTDLVEYQAKLEKSRKHAEAYVDAVNAKAGKRIVFLVPLADGMLEVRKMIVAGKFPGITKVNYRNRPGDRGSIMGGDIMPHQGHLGFRLGAYMHFAALYRMSPVGLKLPGKEGDGLTDEQRAILQKLAWDMVSKYPYAGIAKFEAPQPKKEGEKPVPKSGDGPAPVSDALKGWKETKDLPADTVVADYNAYIEKLPKAERPGVSDVKYYVDGSGQAGVAVLVIVERVEWTHFLTYDKQNKRAAVKKFVSSK